MKRFLGSDDGLEFKVNTTFHSIFIFSLVLYLKSPLSHFYLAPTLLALFIFAICPFITMYLLLSENKKSPPPFGRQAFLKFIQKTLFIEI